MKLKPTKQHALVVFLAFALFASYGSSCSYFSGPTTQTDIGKAVAAADVQKTAVQSATMEAIRMHMNKQITDEQYAQVKSIYTKWAAAETILADALSTWKQDSTDANATAVNAAINAAMANGADLLNLLTAFGVRCRR